MIINIKNTYNFDLYLYKLYNSKIIDIKINSGKNINIKTKNIDKIIFSYNPIFLSEKLSNYSIFNFLSNMGNNIENEINKNMKYIVEILEFRKNRLSNRYINSNLIKKLIKNECIMCLENKPDSNNYFQCKNCINKFLCVDCFKQLQKNKNLNKKCLLCFQDYI